MDSNSDLYSYFSYLVSEKIRCEKRLISPLLGENHFLLDKLSNMSGGQFAYHFLKNDWSIPTCTICGKENKFNPNRREYSINCSNECNYANPNRQKETNIYKKIIINLTCIYVIYRYN
jgi:hypothetical protein